MGLETEHEVELHRLKILRQNAINSKNLYAQFLADVRSRCPHTRITEVDYRPASDYRAAEPPERFCDACGFSEEGWGCGYETLGKSHNRTVKLVPRSELNKLRIKFWI